MSSTYLSLHVHFVFATKARQPMIGADWRNSLHAYMGGIVREMGATPTSIGGVADHVHLLASLKSTHCVADFVREVKRGSRSYACEREPKFSWQDGYAAFTISSSAINPLVAYIANQEEHHKKQSSADELRELLNEYDIKLDERFFE